MVFMRSLVGILVWPSCQMLGQNEENLLKMLQQNFGPLRNCDLKWLFPAVNRA